ncbi:MAG TPA: secretin N-terminal domain-containing protein [Limnochorda sp.]
MAVTLLLLATSAASGQGEGLPATEGEPDVLVQLSLYETDLREALTELAYQTRVNILMTPEVQGVVSAELENVTLRQALETLLAPFGYTFRWTGQSYLVGVPDPRHLAFGRLSVTEAIPLSYIPADRAARLLSDFFSPYVKADPQVNQLVVTGPPEVVERVRRDVALLDRRPAEVELRVLITELSETAARELGIDSLKFENVDDQLALAMQTSLSAQSSPSSLALKHHDVEAQIRALVQQEEATVRGNPRLRVQEGRKATLFAGQRQFFLIASDQTTRLQEVEAGLRVDLRVERVTRDEVILEIAPSSSQVIAQRDSGPVLQSSEISTTVSLAPGETVVLASLDLSQSVATGQGLPLLSRLPLVGWLFGTHSDQKGRRELTIFVTAEPVPPRP